MTNARAESFGENRELSTARTEAPEVESREARLTRLRTTGFRKLRAGRIHVRCYVCGRKMSNMARDEHDPPIAALIETPCERCIMGGKDPESFYYDATGASVEAPDPYCTRCGSYIDGEMIERAADGLCVECAEDDATDFPAGASVLAVDKAERSEAAFVVDPACPDTATTYPSPPSP